MINVPEPLTFNNQLLLTTRQIADYYGCTPKQITDNFGDSKEYFVEGKHYFKLEGTALRQFKEAFGIFGSPSERATDSFRAPFSKYTNVLYLWTKRGCARHAKMLHTNKAWEVFEELEENYFNPKSKTPTPAEVFTNIIPNADTAQLSPRETVHLLLLSAILTPDDAQKVMSIKQAISILSQI